jgi:hypothetical protein
MFRAEKPESLEPSLFLFDACRGKNERRLQTTSERTSYETSLRSRITADELLLVCGEHEYLVARHGYRRPTCSRHERK